MLNLLAITASLLPQGPGSSTAPVVINEFNYDDSSTDDWEFVELYNRSGAPVDISNWTILNPDATGSTYGIPPATTGTDQSHVIALGTVLQPGGFYLLGNPNLVPVAVPGFSQVLPTNGLENSAEAIELRDINGNVVDSVSYEIGRGAFGPHPIEGNGFYGDLVVGNGPSSSTGRKLDGWDDDDNGADFLCCMIPTPGSSNNQASILPYFDDGSAGIVGGIVPNWHGGWVNPFYVDPTVADSQNPHVKPPSPNGGLAISTWDNSGGGNTVAMVTEPVADVLVEAYVHIEGPMTPFNPTPYSPSVPASIPDTYNVADGEWWAMGVRGTAAANGNPPDVGGYFASVAPGIGTRYHFVTGICWAHFRTPTFSQLWLLDMGNGAQPGNPNNYNVLAGPIDIPTSGWHRVRILAQGNEVMANFGGTVGCNDGQVFFGTTTTTNSGGVYLAYREAILYNQNGSAGWHPPVYDDLRVQVPVQTKTFLGTASPTTANTPQIGAQGFATIGSLGSNAFRIQASGLVPLGSPNRAFCGAVLGLSTIPTGFPIAGAPSTALGYVVPTTTVLGFSDAQGEASFAIPIPCNAGFVGVQFSSQIVDLDLFLPAAAPVGTSPAMTTTLGN